MPGKTYVFSFQNVQATINRLTVEGLWEGDDAISIAPNSEHATALVGVDGDATVSYTADTAVRVTIRLKPSSPMNGILNRLYQRSRSGFLNNGFPISIRDTGNGEGGSGAEGHVVVAPTRGLGRNATSREWIIFVNGWQWNEISYEAPGT